MRVKIKEVKYQSRKEKTATHLDVIINSDNLETELSLMLYAMSVIETKEGKTEEILESFSIVINGKDYQDLDTHNGIDINEEIIRYALKASGFEKEKI
jgi:hypothetical protein